MPGREDVVELEGLIVEVLKNRVCRVKLPNGHELLGHLPKNLSKRGITLLPEGEVVIHVKPFDFSSGKIVDVR
jgi:translation initiation factor IF-1